jgi:glycosyltransferase involved in cell wall biosynthesis
VARKVEPRLRGWIVGNGPEKECLETEARELGLLPAGIQFLGQRSDVAALLKQSNILILTSSSEGMPNVIMEGMAARLPVITTPAGDAPVLVQDGINGFVQPFGDIEGISQRMVQLARSDEKRVSMGIHGRKIIEDRFNFIHLAQKVLEIYQMMGEKYNKRGLLTALSQQTPHPRKDQFSSTIKTKTPNSGNVEAGEKSNPSG